MTGVNRVVFVRAVTARALDALVIAIAKGSGMQNEWAGALWVVSYEGGKPIPKHTADLLKNHQEWVCGDYIWGTNGLSSSDGWSRGRSTNWWINCV